MMTDHWHPDRSTGIGPPALETPPVGVGRSIRKSSIRHDRTRDLRQMRTFPRAPVHNVAVSIGESPVSESNWGNVLVVLGGRPGTGKTTIGRLLARRLRAAYLRTDVIAGPMLLDGLTEDKARAGHVAYNIAREIATENLRAGVPVLVDGVHATHDRRALWRDVSQTTHCRLIQFEMTLADEGEHRRRVESRQSQGYVGPTWEQIVDMKYADWSEARDGRRMIVEAFDTNAALAQCLAHVRDTHPV